MLARAPLTRHVKIVFAFLGVALLLIQSVAPSARAADSVYSTKVAALTAKFREIEDKLKKNQFDAPIYLFSTTNESSSRGEVYGLLPYKFDVVARALSSPDNWCDIVTLHLNVKMCLSRSTSIHSALVDVYVGEKNFQEVQDAHHISYQYQAQLDAGNYLHAAFNAENGPYGTRDYIIDIEAMPAPDGSSTFIHFTYAYKSSFASKIAMNIYLGTAGSDKVGFTIVGRDAEGNPQYIGGVQGIVERNVMRYYLAIQAYLDTLRVAENERFEQRISRWYDLTQRFEEQLFEVERDEYLSAKRQEREQQTQAAASKTVAK